MDEKLEPRIINKLCQYSFYIPAYQRGYRWTSQEVEDLLNDINDFEPQQIQTVGGKSWYCLQPIVVKNKTGNEYEVIDGQQRLTTIYLILHYFNQEFVEAKREKLFKIDYQTRQDTTIFLQNLGSETEEEKDNIDCYYIKQVYTTIEKWFEKKEQDINFDKSNFKSKFKFNTKVIWYESAEKDTISVFTRLNIGKISLSNSELIRALYLNSSNFGANLTETNELKLKQKQLEIATEWDNIENTLHNEKFWYFISNEEKPSNRIELIFDIMSEKSGKDDSFHTFRYFNEEKFSRKTVTTIDEKINIIDKNWQEVKKNFQKFHEWFSERNSYHKVGYLICVNKITIKNLFAKSSEMAKSEFKTYLHGQISESLLKVNIDELKYGDKNVKKVLLLYNILTMLNNDKDDSRFPFDIFKKEKWDIEHITAINEDKPKDKKQWLEDVRSYIDKEKDGGEKLINDINNFDESDESNNNFEPLFEEIINHFGENIDDEEINQISNLALLDQKTNRGYKNAVFPVKRKTIIARDKMGLFIPICTKNVFLKYFTDYPPKISFWTREDRQKYQENLRIVLKDYLEG